MSFIFTEPNRSSFYTIYTVESYFKSLRWDDIMKSPIYISLQNSQLM